MRTNEKNRIAVTKWHWICRLSMWLYHINNIWLLRWKLV